MQIIKDIVNKLWLHILAGITVLVLLGTFPDIKVFVKNHINLFGIMVIILPIIFIFVGKSDKE